MQSSLHASSQARISKRIEHFARACRSSHLKINRAVAWLDGDPARARPLAIRLASSSRLSRADMRLARDVRSRGAATASVRPCKSVSSCRRCQRAGCTGLHLRPPEMCRDLLSSARTSCRCHAIRWPRVPVSGRPLLIRELHCTVHTFYAAFSSEVCFSGFKARPLDAPLAPPDRPPSPHPG